MFELVKGNQGAGIYIDPGAGDYAGLLHVAEKLQEDIELVTGVKPPIHEKQTEWVQIIPGTIGSHPVLDEFIAR